MFPTDQSDIISLAPGAHIMNTKSEPSLTKGRRSRQKIVETAAVLFNQKGFTGCSMGDIVMASGLEKGTLYSHFSTKEELALLAFDYAWKDTSDKRVRSLDTVSNAIDKLKLHIDNYVNTPSFPGGCPLLNFAVDADDGNLALRTQVRKALKGWKGFLAKVIEDGQLAGEVNPEVDPDTVAHLVISVLEGATVVSRINKRSAALNDAQRHLNMYLETTVRLRTDSQDGGTAG
jgi:TetR/AcrR family transcriptional regulator, transcriptional repressor for nem operon